jgi:hypothetical protein
MGKKSQYKRSTPVIRLQRNVLKLERYAELILNRLSSWIVEGNAALVPPLENTANIMQDIVDLKASVARLEAQNYVPPKRSFAMILTEGQRVSIAPKHREKYTIAFEKLLSFDPNYLDELVVEKILPTREILVRNGKHTPFIARKSHLVT